ncbi:MAG: adenylyl-sulfate kinase [Anaerolineae bacterium]
MGFYNCCQSNSRRNKMAEHPGFVLWFTGLSGAGKTTLAKALLPKLQELGMRVERLDGDVVRQSLTKDLGFSKEDRDRNIERVTFVAKLLSRNNVAVLAAFISPYQETRNYVRDETTNFIEVHVSAPLAVCEERDVKGMYAKARAGEIENFTGISDPYEEPATPDIDVPTHEQTLDESVDFLIAELAKRGLLPQPVA